MRLGDQAPADRAATANGTTLPLPHPRWRCSTCSTTTSTAAAGLFYRLQRRGPGRPDLHRRGHRRGHDRAAPDHPGPPARRVHQRAKERRRDFTVDWVHLKLNDQAQRTVLLQGPLQVARRAGREADRRPVTAARAARPETRPRRLASSHGVELASAGCEPTHRAILTSATRIWTAPSTRSATRSRPRAAGSPRLPDGDRVGGHPDRRAPVHAAAPDLRGPVVLHPVALDVPDAPDRATGSSSTSSATTSTAVHRGDVVVFARPPLEDQEYADLVKRVIGLPGETDLVPAAATSTSTGSGLDEPLAARTGPDSYTGALPGDARSRSSTCPARSRSRPASTT